MFHGIRNDIETEYNGVLTMSDGTTIEWDHDGGRDINIEPSRPLNAEELIIVYEEIDNDGLINRL